MKKRHVDIVVISDVQLGTFGCHAKELLAYLKSIKPGRVILNGDIIDIWQFNKRYWPKSHMQVIKLLCSWISKGVEINYIAGNHDEMLRKFVGFRMGSFSISNKIVLTADDRKAWIFHGDVFDVTMQYSKFIAKLGAVGYDFLILLNSAINFFASRFGRGPISMSKRIKNSVKSAVKYINQFEHTAADIAIENEYDYVICGHIHQPEIRIIQTDAGVVTYMNSGDWVENLTSLEYYDGQWHLFHFRDSEIDTNPMDGESNEAEVLGNKVLFQNMMKEFQHNMKQSVHFT